MFACYFIDIRVEFEPLLSFVTEGDAGFVTLCVRVVGKNFDAAIVELDTTNISNPFVG